MERTTRGRLRRSRSDDDSNNNDGQNKRKRAQRDLTKTVSVDEDNKNGSGDVIEISPNKNDKPLKCRNCYQFLDDELQFFSGDPEDAVSEVVMLTNSALCLFDNCHTEEVEKPFLKVTLFCVYDEIGHLCSFDSGIIEKNKYIYFSGYVKPAYDEDDSKNGGIYTSRMGPIDEWWLSGFDGGNALLGFSTQFADYVLMRPHHQYEKFMTNCMQKAKLSKLVIEYLNENVFATFDDLLGNIQTLDRHYTQEMLFLHAPFILAQIESYDSSADEDEVRLLTTKCIRKLIYLTGTTVRHDLIKNKPEVRNRLHIQKPKKPVDTLATTTKVVYDILSSAFGDVMAMKDKTVSTKLPKNKPCRSCAGCLREPCGSCCGCKGRTKKCLKKVCLSIAVQEADDGDADSTDDSEDEMDKKVKAIHLSKFDRAHHRLKEGQKTNVKWVCDSDTIVDNKVKYYSAVMINGELIKIGDCVMVVPDRDCSLYVAKVSYMFEDKHGDKLMHVNWFWRGIDTVLGDLAEKKELFMANCCDDIPAGSVACKCTVLRKEYPANWHLMGDSDNPELDVVIDSNSDKERTFYYQKWYDHESGRFENPPEGVECKDSESNYNFCDACRRKGMTEAHETPCFGDLLTKNSRQRKYSFFHLNGQKFHVGDCVYLAPEAYDFPANWCPSEIETASPSKNDSVRYSEMYRKTSVHGRGRYRGILKPFCIGRILSISSDVDKSTMGCIRVAVFFRAENIPGGESSIINSDFNLLYWSDEEVTVSMEMLKGKCYVAYADNVKGDKEDFRLAGPHRFYFEQGYSLKKKCYFEVPDKAKSYGKFTQGANKEYKEGVWEEYPPVQKRLRSLDIFAGCGGLSDGFHRAEISKTVWAIENETNAAEAFRLNNPDCIVFNEDCNVLLKRVMEGFTHDQQGQRLPQKGEVDLMLGGPPCQGFSGMNRFNQRQYSLFKNSLIATYVSYCDYYRPRFFILENVRNFVAFKKSTILKLILVCLVRMGYQCSFAVLQAGHYGVPQTRRRLIILAAAPGEKLPYFPEPLHVFNLRGSELSVIIDDNKYMSNIKWKNSAPYRAVTVRDAMSDLPVIENGWFRHKMSYGGPPLSHFQKMVRRNETMLHDHVCKEMSSLVVARFHHIPLIPGADWRDLPNIALRFHDGTIVKKLRYTHHDAKNGKAPNGALRGVCVCAEGKEACDPLDRQQDTLIPWCLPHTGNRHGHWAGLYGRLDWDGYFCTTVTNPEPMGKQGCVVHPEQHRVVSVRECARSQGFSDSYRFSGHVLDRHRQIGNAVPPPMGYAIAMEIRKCLRSS